jgi:hypothetical protein
VNDHHHHHVDLDLLFDLDTRPHRDLLVCSTLSGSNNSRR